MIGACRRCAYHSIGGALREGGGGVEEQYLEAARGVIHKQLARGGIELL